MEKIIGVVVVLFLVGGRGMYWTRVPIVFKFSNSLAWNLTLRRLL